MNQFFTDIDLIKAWLKEYSIKRYTIHTITNKKSGKNTANNNIHNNNIETELSFTVDVQENVVIGHGNLKALPIKFGVINGSFNLYNQRYIKDLKGCPTIVGKSFSVTGNRLTSLDGGPLEVNGYYDCSANQLKNLKGGPRLISGSFRADKNQLKTLQWCPLKICGFLSCKNNPIENFHYLPDKLGGEIYFTVNEKITEYEGKAWLDIEKMNIMFKEKNNLEEELADFTNSNIHAPVFKL